MEKVSTNLQGIKLTAKKGGQGELAAKMLANIGITINGTEPHDICVHNSKLYSRVFREGPLGLGEAYMDGWWDCEQLDVFFAKILRARFDTKLNTTFKHSLLTWIAKHINFQTKSRAWMVAKKHYDIGNKLFAAMLDKRMIYSCGYWAHASTLDEAQEAKLDLICKKLYLQPGQTLLDIGCGWGGLAKFAAENYGVQVVGITISKQQYEHAKKVCANLPIDIRLQDYRDIHETFDRIVSVGMFEHVGHMNYQAFMQTVHHALKDDGIFLLHTIGVNETYSLANEWITKYIFPNGVLPSISQISKAAEKMLVVEDWHNFGAHYDRTLMAWHHNFMNAWNNLKSQYDDRFYRMWSYYLLSCAGSFRARLNQLWQIVFSKHGIINGYQSIR